MGRPRKQPNQGLPRRVYIRSGTYYYVHRDGRWENLGRDVAQVCKIAAAYNSGATLYGTMAYWLDEWKKELLARVAAGSLAPRTREDYTNDIEMLKLFFGKMAPNSIEPHHVAEYLAIGRETDRPVRANREKAAFSSCMSWMIEHNKAGLKVNPCKAVRRNMETARDRYITDDEYNAVMDQCGPAEKAWAEMIYRTLQRPADILKWTKQNLVRDGETTFLQFTQSKTGAHMKIVVTPLLESAFAQLAAARSGVKTIYLIPREDGRPYTETGIASMFRRATVKAQLVDYAPYDNKAKGATDMWNDGVPIKTISELCGHDSTTTTEIYIRRHSRTVVMPNDRLPKRSVAARQK